MAELVGVFSIQPNAGMQERFVDFMVTEGFARAQNVPGSVFRGGKSMIAYQQLLEAAESGQYLWLVTAADNLNSETFARVLERIAGAGGDELATLASVSGATLHVVRGAVTTSSRGRDGESLKTKGGQP